MINQVGITAPKKIKPIMIGLTTSSSNWPSWNHTEFKGASALNIISATTRKMTATISDQTLLLSSFKIGNRLIIATTTANTITKERLEPDLTTSVGEMFSCKEGFVMGLMVS